MTDVQKLTSEVQAAYEQAQKADTALAQFLNGLGEEVDSTNSAGWNDDDCSRGL